MRTRPGLKPAGSGNGSSSNQEKAGGGSSFDTTSKRSAGPCDLAADRLGPSCNLGSNFLSAGLRLKVQLLRPNPSRKQRYKDLQLKSAQRRHDTEARNAHACRIAHRAKPGRADSHWRSFDFGSAHSHARRTLPLVSAQDDTFRKLLPRLLLHAPSVEECDHNRAPCPEVTGYHGIERNRSPPLRMTP